MQGDEADHEEDALEHARLGKAVEADIRGFSTGVTASFAAVGGAIKQIPDLALQVWQVLKVSNALCACSSLIVASPRAWQVLNVLVSFPGLRQPDAWPHLRCTCLKARLPWPCARCPCMVLGSVCNLEHAAQAPLIHLPHMLRRGPWLPPSAMSI